MADFYNEDGLRCPFCGVRPRSLMPIDSRTTGLSWWVCPQCELECQIARASALVR
jgi:formate dehydrogenase maturation protein FdhE